MFSQIGYYICVPFAALLRMFYQMTGSYGLSLVFFTLIVKLVLLPFQMKSKKSMVRMNRLQPKMKEIQKIYANNKAKQNEEIQKLYQEEGMSPMSGCLWSFLPLFVIWPLYSIMRLPITRFMMLAETVVTQAKDALTAAGIQLTMSSAYEQIEIVKKIGKNLPAFGKSVAGWIDINFSFLGIDLASTSAQGFKSLTSGSVSWGAVGLMLIPIIAAAVNFLQSKITMKGQPENPSSKSMLYLMPLMSIWFCWIMPAAMGIYWIVMAAFSCVQEAILGDVYTKKLETEESERAAKRDAARKYRMEEAKRQQQEQSSRDREREKARREKKAAEEAGAKKKVSTTEAGRVGERPYARGRSFQEEHYEKK